MFSRSFFFFIPVFCLLLIAVSLSGCVPAKDRDSYDYDNDRYCRYGNCGDGYGGTYSGWNRCGSYDFDNDHRRCGTGGRYESKCGHDRRCHSDSRCGGKDRCGGRDSKCAKNSRCGRDTRCAGDKNDKPKHPGILIPNPKKPTQYDMPPHHQPRPAVIPRPADSIVKPSCPPGTDYNGRSCIVPKNRRRPGDRGDINPCPKGMWVSGDRCVGKS